LNELRYEYRNVCHGGRENLFSRAILFDTGENSRLAVLRWFFFDEILSRRKSIERSASAHPSLTSNGISIIYVIDTLDMQISFAEAKAS